jgi:hypothetical protein
LADLPRRNLAISLRNPAVAYNAGRMSKDAPMAELAQLGPQELAEVRAWIDRIAPDSRATAAGLAAGHRIPLLRSPKLADPAQAGDLKKQVTELPTHAAL